MAYLWREGEDLYKNMLQLKSYDHSKEQKLRINTNLQKDKRKYNKKAGFLLSLEDF